jgi:hypothetical protein
LAAIIGRKHEIRILDHSHSWKYEIKKQLIYPNEYQLFRTLNNEKEVNQGKELIFEIK